MAKKDSYDASSIRALTPRQHLIKRMGLVFGSVESDGEEFSKQKSVAVREILDNGLDEIRAGYGQYLRLSFFEDGSFEVQDSGRGIPVEKSHDSEGNPISALALALSVLQAGGKFETDSKRYSSGLNGLGGSAVVNVSSRASVWVYRKNREYFLEFQDGVPGYFKNDKPGSDFTPLKDMTYVKSSADKRSATEKKKFPTGTKIRIWLDESVFSSSNPYDDQDIIARLRGTAFLVPEMYAEVYNELNQIEDPETSKEEPQREEFHFPEGITELIELNEPQPKLHDTIIFNATGTFAEKNVPVLQKDGSVKNQTVDRDVPIELAFRYNSGYETNFDSYVNTIHTKLGGVHETGFQRAMQKAFNERFQSMRGILPKGDEPPIVDDFMEGLTAVLSIQVSEPNFSSQSKEQLTGREVQKAVQEVLTNEFEKWINDRKNSDALQMIAKKVSTASKNRQRAKEQRDLARQKNELSNATLPSKLIDCEWAGTDDAELYICEGESAKTALQNARDGRRNALLPLKGKIINAHLKSSKDVHNSEEVKNIITTLGAGSGKTFDIEKMRYGKVFIAVDADPDGANIACLIYALFWHLFHQVIEENRLFMIQTPLFVITVKGRKARKMFAQDEKERDSLVTELEENGEKYVISRLKGLGEVRPEDLEETAIDPETRTVLQITNDDLEKAFDTLDLLLGSNAQHRKEWVRATDVDQERLGE